MNSTLLRQRLLASLLLGSVAVPLASVHGQDQRSRKRHETSLKVFSDLPWHKWLDEDVRYIITDQERTDFKALTTDQQRDDFVEAFWERRNPNPGSEENKFKEEHYERFAYANERFGADTPGWKTDRGRVYIVYGSPDKREQYPVRTRTPPATGASEQRSSFEVWSYGFIKGLGYGVFFVFLDKCDCGEYLLQHNPRSQISILYGPPDWVEYHYSDASSNCKTAVTAKLPADWEVWHYPLIEDIGKDIGFGFSDACDYGKFEGPTLWQRM